MLVSATVVVAPEQRVCEEGVAVTVGIGLTVTVAVDDVPAQDPTDGVTVYIAVPAVLPVVVKV